MMNNGLKYFKIDERINDALWHESFQRIDTLNHKVKIYDENYLQNEKTYIDLSVKVGDTLTYSENEYLTLDKISWASWHSTSYTSKLFTYHDGLAGDVKTYFKNIGLYSYTSFPNTKTINLKLTACVIDGIIFGDSTAVGVKKNDSETIPIKFSLSQNYPNPFNPTTTIEYSVPSVEFVSLKIYDVLGREVATLINQSHKPGIYKTDWNATNFASGIYYYSLRTNNKILSKKMLHLK